MGFELRVTKKAKDGLDWLSQTGRQSNLKKILELLDSLEMNPWVNPPPYES
jgi:Txe/YoeB family toxin of Txe-Axe toxin-antitoxin module